MKINKEQLNLIYETFKYSAVSQLKQKDTFTIVAAVGLYQGLKYKGSLIRAIKAGVAVAGGLSALNGLQNVIINWDKIKRV